MGTSAGTADAFFDTGQQIGGTPVEARSTALFHRILGDENQARSRALDIADAIEAEIHGSGWRPGHKLGAESELARRYACSRRIVRQASRALLARGGVEVLRGRAGGHVVAAVKLDTARETIAAALSGEAARRQAAQALAMLAPRAPIEDPAVDFARSVLTRLTSDSPTPAPCRAREPRAESIAAHIESELSFWMAQRPDGRTGVLDAMCEHYGVSLQIVVQAVRLLEDAGVAKLQKGRTGGLALKCDRSLRAVRTAHLHFASHQMPIEQCDRMVRTINIALITLASQEDRGPVEPLQAALAQMRACDRPTAVGMQWYILQRAISDCAANDPLHLLARAFAANIVRIRPTRPELQDDQARVLIEASHTIVDNILAHRIGDSAQAHLRCQEALRPSW